MMLRMAFELVCERTERHTKKITLAEAQTMGLVDNAGEMIPDPPPMFDLTLRKSDGEVVEVKFGWLCETCEQSVSNYVDRIMKKPVPKKDDEAKDPKEDPKLPLGPPEEKAVVEPVEEIPKAPAKKAAKAPAKKADAPKSDPKPAAPPALELAPPDPDEGPDDDDDVDF